MSKHYQSSLSILTDGEKHVPWLVVSNDDPLQPKLFGWVETTKPSSPGSGRV